MSGEYYFWFNVNYRLDDAAEPTPSKSNGEDHAQSPDQAQAPEKEAPSAGPSQDRLGLVICAPERIRTSNPCGTAF